MPHFLSLTKIKPLAFLVTELKPAKNCSSHMHATAAFASSKRDRATQRKMLYFLSLAKSKPHWHYSSKRADAPTRRTYAATQNAGIHHNTRSSTHAKTHA
jgi:hypothetical protein